MSLNQLQKFIANGKNLSTESFDYYHMGGALPEELRQFPQLRRLKIHVDTDAKWVGMPDWFGSLPLEELALVGFKAKSLFSCVGKLHRLKKLDLASCVLENAPVLQQLPELETLRFTHCPALPTGIEAMAQLEYLYIEHTPLSEIPDWVYGCTNLRRLVIHKGLNCERVERSFAPLKRLSILTISHSEALRELGEAVFEGLEALENLSLWACRLQRLPDSLARLPCLKDLFIRRNQLQSLPEHWASDKIESIWAEDNQITALPAAIAQMQQLKTLSASNNQLRSLPQGLEKLPHLKEVLLQQNPFVQPPLDLLRSEVIRHIRITEPNTVFDANNTLFMETCRSLELSYEDRVGFYWLLSDEEAKIVEIPLSAILQAARTGEKVFNDAVDRALELRYARAPKPLHKGAVLQVRGDVPYNKTQLKERLTALGIVYGTSLKANTTHVLVGKKIKDTEQREGLTWLSVGLLEQYLKDNEEQHIAQAEKSQDEAGKHTIEQLSALLLSEDETNVQLAIELLKGGGVPTSLLTELFLIFKNRERKKKLRDDAKNMLLLNASPALVACLSSKKQIFYDKRPSSYKLISALQEFTQGTELDLMKMLLHLHRQGESVNFTAQSLLSAAEFEQFKQALQK